MKTYTFDKKTFAVQMTATGIFCILLIVASLYGIATTAYAGLLCIVILVCAYTVWNTFVSISNPSEVIIGEDFISFSAYGKEHTYDFADIERFKIREFPSAGKIFLRVNDATCMKGRYWIHTKMFNVDVHTDGQELFMELLDMEFRMHPDSLKARARTVNTEFNEMRRKKAISQSCDN